MLWKRRTGSVDAMNQNNEPVAEPANEPVVSTNTEPHANIEPQAQTGAAGSTAEDTLEAYRGIVDQMKVQNDLLMKANESLQAQISVLIRNGASTVPGEPQVQAQSPDPIGDKDYVPLADLGFEIGKKDYRSHNMTQKE